MSSNPPGEFVLDRAAMGNDGPDNSNLDHHPAVESETRMSKRERLSGKVKNLLHVRNDQIDLVAKEDRVILAASPAAISGDGRLDESAPPRPGPEGFKQLIQHPVDTIKAKTERKTNKEVAANLMSPEVTHAQDVELIRAKDTLDTAKTEEEKLQACNDLETLKKARQDLFVRWTMDRHVSKLKRLESKEEQVRSRNKPGSHRDTGDEERLGWKSYGQQVRLSHHLVKSQ